jgi:DNA polymerase-3 subunit alpha
MNPVRSYIKENLDELLEKVNHKAFADNWEKYAKGSISKWEMDAVSCYFHDHELAYVDEYDYGFADFAELPDEPLVDRVVNIKGKQVPLFKIERIMGTVLDRDKNKKTVTLLTKSGVVTVKVFGQVFANYDKQISVKGADGKKHVIEKSFFSRGNKIVVSGIRREDSFIAKKYSKTPWHLVELITDINEFGEIETRGTRAGDEEE